MSDSSFKCAATDWEYRASIPASITLSRVTVLIYSPMAGRVLLDDLRVVHGGE